MSAAAPARKFRPESRPQPAIGKLMINARLQAGTPRDLTATDRIPQTIR